MNGLCLVQVSCQYKHLPQVTASLVQKVWPEIQKSKKYWSVILTNICNYLKIGNPNDRLLKFEICLDNSWYCFWVIYIKKYFFKYFEQMRILLRWLKHESSRLSFLQETDKHTIIGLIWSHVHDKTKSFFFAFTPIIFREYS